ncbi:MAG: hypothetical protein IPK28_08455 [Devosia sp.]|nr:hypothetical protein [Devosia sp.]
MMMKMALAAAAFAFTCLPACAATISIVSMHYSAAHSVPHLHYDGPTVAGDVATLRDMYESFVKCRISCLGPDGGATAILTLRGEGGDYYEGLAIADFLRENHIATVVERGSFCYLACAFAFLGAPATPASRVSAPTSTEWSSQAAQWAFTRPTGTRMRSFPPLSSGEPWRRRAIRATAWH